ncbi:MAG TPA: metallophosphoesterase [Polyangiaceae bacterium]|nr:metallophosphoesterase [Polyangiaceae bacterium]
MSRALSIALFLAVALTITGLVHYYLWIRLVRDLGLAPPWHRALTGVFVILYLSLPASFVLARNAQGGLAEVVLWATFVWMGLLLITFVVLLGAELARGIWALAASVLEVEAPRDPERRRVLARLYSGSVTLIAAGLGLVAVRSGLAGAALKEVRVRLSRLPSALDGLTIVQLTDVHVGPTIRREFVEDIVRRTNALMPDIVAITGDLVDGSVEELRDHVAPLAELRAKYGVYFVTGNHEYYSGAESWCRELTRIGIRVLRNERVSIGDEAASFDLAGVDDYEARRFGSRADLARALAGRDESREVVLLAHQPRAVLEAQHHGVGLVLSGHTHGGQIWPWNFLVRLQQPVVAGLARFGQTLVYVSSGTGYWGPPMRLGVPAEITRVVLEAGERA